MSVVRFARVSFGYGGAGDILEELELDFDNGFTGVIGENGGGKTTLLRLIAGELEPTAGELVVDAEVGDRLLCRQRVDRRDPTLAEFAGSYERQALRWQARLGVHHLDFADYAQFSPGERKRWQLACALSRRPRVLLLDEPSNHLDASGRALLLDALRGYRGTCVLVSHDRELLDALCSRTLRLRGGRASVLALPYSQARLAWRAERERQARVHGQRRATLRKSERNRARLRHQRARAEGSIGASSRIKGPKDSDGRSVNRRARAAAGEATIARKLAVAAGRAARQRDELANTVVDKVRGTAIGFQGRQHARRRLAVFDGELRVGQRTLAREVHVALQRDSRVRIRGDNGAGKTTLLLALLERARLSDDELLYVPQLLTAEHERAVRAQLARATSARRGKTMTLAAALGLDPARVLASAAYSPGQLRKLLIADGLAHEVCLLALDEPTNHLDLPSVERLEEALGEFVGALVVVTHDERFAAALKLQEWHIESGNVLQGTSGELVG